MNSTRIALGTACLALVVTAADTRSQEYMSPAGECGFDLEDRGFYTFEDFQYFKAPVADIRTPRHVARAYRDAPFPYSAGTQGVDSTASNLFFDGSFGETFPFMGWNLEPGDIPNCMSAAGYSTFFQASAHILLDTDSPSNPVINTDYRVGFGLSGRPFRSFRALAFRAHAFHESTHIGDEYALEASRDPAFQRWNVSYEAIEGFLALDHYRNTHRFFMPAYVRAYGGARRLTNLFDVFSPWTAAFDEFVTSSTNGSNPLLASEQWEQQLGGELYLRGWLSDHLDHGHFYKWQYMMAAVDIARVNLLDVAAPGMVWSTHAMAGLVWGDHFNAKRSNQLTLNWYRGVNPHGQFRNSELEWLGLTLTIRF